MKKFYINMYGLAVLCWSGVVYVTHHSSWWIVLMIASYVFIGVCRPRLKWEPRDTWFGLFHDRATCNWQFVHNGPIILHHTFRFYLVIVPCVPIIWDWTIDTEHDMVEDAKVCAEKMKTLFHIPFYKEPPI